jgi:dymeclin
MLLHRNQHFKMFILSRINIDQLIVPLLKVIYTKPDKNSHHIYMALIIVLILSEDDLFNKSIHNIVRSILFILYYFDNIIFDCFFFQFPDD